MFDHAEMAAAFTRPGIDPRQWVSNGIVDADTDDAHSVRFTGDDGNPLPTGPLVSVTLQPSGISVVCRVASFIAGVGEGTWVPIGPGDEVLVVLPSGDERSNPCIIARLNQALDTWPTTVAGQDATKNTFGFWRLRVPFIIESAASFFIRSALTGSQIGIDATGQVILNTGEKNRLMLSSDSLGMASGDGDTFMEIHVSDKAVALGAGQSKFYLAASGSSQLFIDGDLNIGTSGAAGKGHAVTIEQLISWTANLLCALATTSSLNPAGPYGAPFLVPGASAAVLNATLSAMIPAMVTPAPVGTSGAPGGNMAPLAPSYQLLNVALLNPLPTIDPTGLIPGVGVAGLMY